MTNSVFLVAFFKFDDRGPEYGFERIHLQHIWKTEAEARKGMSFCDEAGWYEGVLIEERKLGWSHKRCKRIWFALEGNYDGPLSEFPEPKFYKDVSGLIG